VKHGKRELIIGQATCGCVAPYCFVGVIDTMFVVAVRA